MSFLIIIGTLVIVIGVIAQFVVATMITVAIALFLGGFALFALPVPYNTIGPVLYYLFLIWVSYKIVVD